jgi:hypothetical protein
MIYSADPIRNLTCTDSHWGRFRDNTGEHTSGDDVDRHYERPKAGSENSRLRHGKEPLDVKGGVDVDDDTHEDHRAKPKDEG